MSDLINGSPAGAMPAGGYVLKAQTVRIACDLLDKATGEPAYPGLWAEVRRNLTIGERKDLREAAAAIDQRADDLTAATMTRARELDAALAEIADENDPRRVPLLIEKRDLLTTYRHAGDQIVLDRFALIAPHVHRWNLFTENDAGEIVPVPAPKAAGLAVVEQIDTDLVLWLVRATLMAYREGFAIGSATSGAPQEPTPAPNGTASKGGRSASRPSQKKSSSLAA